MNYTLKERPSDFIVKEIPKLKFEEGQYSIFKLKKEDYSTVYILDLIAKFLNIKLRDIGFAGNKDRRAITEQYISIKNIQKNKVKLFKKEGVEIEFIGNSSRPITLGNLVGNSFEIIVRNVNSKPILKPWFVNYFGEQRFSTSNVEIGRSLLKKDFKKTAELLIENSYNQVKKHIEKNPQDYVGAITKIPMKTIGIFINSFQSYVWNKTVSLRISKDNKTSKIQISKQILQVPISKPLNFEIPLVGFETENLPDETKLILEEEGISQRDFIIKQISHLSAGGSFRKAITEVKDISFEKIEDKSYKLKFTLPKGSYATVFVQQIFSKRL